MNMKSTRASFPAALSALIALPLALSSPRGLADTVIYETGFEVSEGYVLGSPLVGQQGWQGFGSGGNGILSGYFAGQGQQAYVGMTGPTGGDDSLFVWPVVHAPLSPCTTTNLRFSVDMMIVDSTNSRWDEFVWSLYDGEGYWLMALNFDNGYERIFYAYEGLDDWVDTDMDIETGRKYALVVDLDFPGNRWRAYLDGEVLVASAPLSIYGPEGGFGDLDAAYWPFDLDRPGNNFMVFDNYRLVAQPGQPPPPGLRLISVDDAGATLRVHGRPGCSYLVQSTSNFATWDDLHTDTPNAEGFFDYTDPLPNPEGLRFYRARWLE